MKVAVVCLLSLLSVQGLFGAYIPVNTDANKSINDHSLQVAETRSVDTYGPRINLKECFDATKSIGGLVISGWKLFNKRNEILRKTKDEKQKCSKLTIAEELQKCMKDAEEAEKIQMGDFNKDLMNLIPVVLTTSGQLFKCFF